MSVIEEIMKSAGNAKASDVHITVGVSPKMRINGNLVTMSFPKMTAKDTLEIVLGMMTQLQRERFEEWGEYDMAFSIAGVGRYRVHAYKQKGYVALALRLIHAQVPSIESLGVPEEVVGLCGKKSGMILVTGASGSGKSTTLAAIVDRINSNREAHIITLEKPIEYVHQSRMAMINQREIGTDSPSYVDALRAALREDADIIVVDELSGAEEIDAAMTAVETGHLVIAAIQAGDGPDTMDRLIDAFPLSRQKQVGIRLAYAIEALISQQMQPSIGNRPRTAEFDIVYADDELRRLLRERKRV